MPKFLIEIPHSEDIIECARVVKVFLATGSHFLSNAEWGCSDGCHKAWLIVDVDTREDALRVVPSAFRSQATIVKLNRFTMEEIDAILGHHRG